MRMKIWVVLCEYEDLALPGVPQRALLDMVLLDTPDTVKEQTDLYNSVVAEYTALHQNFFQMMGMEKVKLIPFSMSPIKTDVGRRQFQLILEHQVTATILNKDFETLFAQIDEMQQIKPTPEDK